MSHVCISFAATAKNLADRHPQEHTLVVASTVKNVHFAGDYFRDAGTWTAQEVEHASATFTAFMAAFRAPFSAWLAHKVPADTSTAAATVFAAAGMTVAFTTAATVFAAAGMTVGAPFSARHTLGVLADTFTTAATVFAAAGITVGAPFSAWHTL